MRTKLLIITLLISTWASGTFRIDSVTVDSAWNNDTVLNTQPVARRMVKLSVYPVAADSVTCFADLSLDSGKTWISDREKYDGVGKTPSFRAAPNKKKSVTIIVKSGDTAGVVFKVTARKDTASIGRCRMTNQSLTGWIEDVTGYGYFTDDVSLQGLMDGGYQEFYVNGYINGFQQSMLTSDSLRYCSIMAFDFGTMARASDMYVDKRTRLTRKTTLSAYDSTIAIAKPVLGGFSVVAHFKHFYFEVGMTGYDAADSLVAKGDAIKFLNFYEQKANQP